MSRETNTTSKKRQTDAVENALFRRALGYETEEATLLPDEETGERITKIVRKQVAPSIQAAIAWLKAYRPEIWGKSSAESDAEDVSELYSALTGSFKQSSEAEHDD